MKRIGFVTLKGGCGKTTLAVHMAWYLHELGHPVALIDGDPVGGSHEWANDGPGFPFPILYPDEPWPEDRWLVFDTEAHPEDDDLRALADTLDLAIIPVGIDTAELSAGLKTVPALSQGRCMVRGVVSRGEHYGLADNDNMRAAMQSSGLPTYFTVIRQNKTYKYARLEGVPVFACSKPNRMVLWREFEKFGEEALNGL